MKTNLNVNSKPFSYWPSFISAPYDQSFLFNSTYDNNLITSMISEWNARQSLTDLFSRWSSPATVASGTKPLSLLLYNVQGIRHKFSKIRTLLDDVQPTIMTLVETGIVDTQELRKFIPEYVHFITSGINSWGGIVVLVHRSVHCSLIFYSPNFLVVDIVLSSSTLRI